MHVEYKTLEYDATVDAAIDHFRSRVAKAKAAIPAYTLGMVAPIPKAGVVPSVAPWGGAGDFMI